MKGVDHVIDEDHTSRNNYIPRCSSRRDESKIEVCFGSLKIIVGLENIRWRWWGLQVDDPT